MSSIKHEYTSSVVRHMLAYLKVRGLIPLVRQCLVCCDVRINTSFYPELKVKTQVQNTSGTREIELTESPV